MQAINYYSGTQPVSNLRLTTSVLYTKVPGDGDKFLERHLISLGYSTLIY